MKTMFFRFLVIALSFSLFSGAELWAQKDPQQTQEEIFTLANQVRKKLLMLTEYGPFDYLYFSIKPAEKGYGVILQGYAAQPMLKKAAENAIKRIEAVDLVENQIEVLPVSMTDETIRREAYFKIYNNQSLVRYNPNRGAPVYGSPEELRRRSMMGISQDPPMGFHPIAIIVKGGHITLEGVVDTEFDKNVAGLAANQVRSVFSVTNNLVVPPAGKK